MAYLGPDQKSAAARDVDGWEECEDVAGLTLSLLALVGALGSAVALPVATAGVMLAVAKYKKNAARHMAEDPPDENYKRAVELSGPWMHARAFGPEGRIGPLGEASLLLVDQARLLDAFVQALERVEGAQAAAAVPALHARAEEALTFGQQCSELLRAGPPVVEQLARALETSAPRPKRGGFRRDELALRAVLLEADDPLDTLLERLPDGALALLLRAGCSADDLRFDVRRAVERPVLDAVLAWPAGELAQALRRAAEASADLGVALAAWLPMFAVRVQAR